jgi:hypothetical protein
MYSPMVVWASLAIGCNENRPRCLYAPKRLFPMPFRLRGVQRRNCSARRRLCSLPVWAATGNHRALAGAPEFEPKWPRRTVTIEINDQCSCRCKALVKRPRVPSWWPCWVGRGTSGHRGMPRSYRPRYCSGNHCGGGRSHRDDRRHRARATNTTMIRRPRSWPRGEYPAVQRRDSCAISWPASSVSPIRNGRVGSLSDRIHSSSLGKVPKPMPGVSRTRGDGSCRASKWCARPALLRIRPCRAIRGPLPMA